MLPVTSTTLRIFLHALAATVWVGGQLTLAGVLPALRPSGRETLRSVGRQFQLLAWPAFAILVATGIWNLFEVSLGDRSTEYLVTLSVKLAFVTGSGLAAAIHVLVAAPRVRRAPTEASYRRAAALSGALEGTATLLAIGALFLGVLLRG
ncbi:MAG: CopD family protein [Acidimicrobiia bacterium]|nr:CopD family protein [Acidimicrobiia bacterium]